MLKDLIKEIRGNEVELQGDNDGIQIYKALDHSAWYIVKNSEVAFELYPAVSKLDGKPAILTEYDIHA
jgi:hypothetical protein